MLDWLHIVVSDDVVVVLDGGVDDYDNDPLWIDRNDKCNDDCIGALERIWVDDCEYWRDTDGCNDNCTVLLVIQ